MIAANTENNRCIEKLRKSYLIMALSVENWPLSIISNKIRLSGGKKALKALVKKASLAAACRSGEGTSYTSVKLRHDSNTAQK